MWYTLTETEKEYIKEKYNLYLLHETYKKHTFENGICNCGKISDLYLYSYASMDKILDRDINVLEYNTYLVVNEATNFMFSERLIDKISVPILKEYKRFDVIGKLVLFLSRTSKKEEVSKIIDYEPNAVISLLNYQETSYYLSKDMLKKITNIVLQKPEVPIPRWVLNVIVNDLPVEISSIKNKLNFKNTARVEFKLSEDNLEEKLKKINELTIKHKLKYIHIRISKN